MKKNKFKILAGLFSITILSIPLSTFAGYLSFNQDDEYEYFDCSAEGYSNTDTVTINTHTVNGMGFCRGEPYVSGASGQITGLPADQLKSYYFKVKKVRAPWYVLVKTHHRYSESHIEYNISGGTVSCYRQTTPIGGKTLFADGKAYC